MDQHVKCINCEHSSPAILDRERLHCEAIDGLSIEKMGASTSSDYGSFSWLMVTHDFYCARFELK